MTRKILTITALLTTACAALMAQAVVAASPSNTSTTHFTTEDQVVSFWMPGTPTKSSGVEHEGKDSRWTRYEHANGNFVVAAVVYELTGAPHTGNEEYWLERVSDEFLKRLGTDFKLGKVDGKKKLQLGPAKMKGLQLQITGDAIQSRARWFIGACRVYFFQASHALNDKAARKSADRFFQSVAIQDPVMKTCELTPD